MVLAILVMITALSISAVAIYYSIAGLVAIFAAAAIPIMIMGGVLEVGKLVTAVWLHRYWQKATWWLKTYLTTAVIVLMFITSMGIFGFLSKAHIEQTSASEESVAKVQQIDSEIARLTAIIDRADKKVEQLESSGTGADANIQSQIDKEQERIDKAYERIQPAIDQQNKIIEDARASDNTRTKPYEDQLANIQDEILRLETSAKDYETKIENLDADTSVTQPLLDNIKEIEEEIIRVTNQINSKEDAQVKAAQAIIGVTSDGLFGSNTRRALASWVDGQRERIKELNVEISELRKNAGDDVDQERERITQIITDIRTVQIPALKERELTMLGKIDEVRQTESPVIQTARDEIQRLRESAEDQVANSQALIERLRGQLAQTDKADEIDAAVEEQLAKIKTAEDEIDTLTEEKYALEAEYRKLEAEVGPIKYIAEFVYGEQADKNMLEEAVRWVIIVIIFVFDPLAVLLLIASQYTFEFSKRRDDSGERLRREYEQLRAQRIIDNPGYNIDDPKEDEYENSRTEAGEEESQDAETLRTRQDEESIQRETSNDSVVATENQGEVDVTELTTTTDDDLGDSISKDNIAKSYAPDDRMEQSEVQTDEQGSKVVEKKDSESPDVLSDIEQWNNWVQAAEAEVAKEEMQARIQRIQEQEEDPDITEKKRLWKIENPGEKVKTQKNLYVRGMISKLPWEDFESELRAKPDLTEVIEPEGYVQNSEQNEKSVWNRIKRDSE